MAKGERNELEVQGGGNLEVMKALPTAMFSCLNRDEASQVCRAQAG